MSLCGVRALPRQARGVLKRTNRGILTRYSHARLLTTSTSSRGVLAPSSSSSHRDSRSARHGIPNGRRSFADISSLPNARMSPLEPDTSIQVAKLESNLATVRQSLSGPLTLTEKILYSHLDDPSSAGAIERGSSYIFLRPDRVALQDASGPFALLQFINSGLKEVAVPTTVHCDHLIVAKSGAKADLDTAIAENIETYDFLGSASAKFGIGFWKPGSGIIHQIVLENYAFPGGMMIGTDSHTPNAGGLGMCAVGVGGADAMDVMAGFPLELKAPKVIGVKLTGELSGWTAPKDVIMKLASLLTVKGGTGCVVEYFGEGVNSISCTGMATICNMGAEVGATCSVFPFAPKMSDYLRKTSRGDIADLAEKWSQTSSFLSADPGAKYDQVVEIDLSTLRPSVNGPFTPDLAHQVGDEFTANLKKNEWPQKLSGSLIGSCTNSSYEDLSRAANICEEAKARGLKVKVPFYITPGSEQIRATIERDGQLATFESVGASVLANACGPCIGMWDRDDVAKGEPNSLIASYNRNFAKRNDNNAGTHTFLSSPELATALAFAGDITFNPETDSLKDSNGADFKFSNPNGDALPEKGFDAGEETFQAPPKERNAEIKIRNESEKLEYLDPWPAWNGDDIDEAIVLMKTRGKLTTDHISPGGPWLKYRGHLDNLSNNTFIGAVNDENGEVNSIRNVLKDEYQTAPDVARAYKAAKQPWVVVGGDNYGEGSSRESAALQPRHLGGVAVIAKSFARIHETNLKKQGMLALTFVNPEDYDKVQSGDRLSIRGLSPIHAKYHFGPDSKLFVQVKPRDGDELKHFEVRHSFNDDQIEWFKAGSALNKLKNSLSSQS